jgi:hypothetical protein
MTKIRLEACSTCALNKPKLRAVVERFGAAHSQSLELIVKECLELCQDDCVFRLEGKPLIVSEFGATTLEAKLKEAVQKLGVV